MRLIPHVLTQLGLCFRNRGQSILCSLSISILAKVSCLHFSSEWRTNLYCSLIAGISSPGTLGLFSFFNIVAWVLVFLFVEETRRISLEDLDFIYAVPKSKFLKFQLKEYAPWVLKGVVLSLLGRKGASTDDIADDESISQHPRRGPRPQLYKPPDLDQWDRSDSEIEMDQIDPDGISQVSSA